MATPQDCSIGVIADSTYGTFQAPTRFYEFTDEGFDWKPNRVQGAGLRVAGRVAGRFPRRAGGSGAASERVLTPACLPAAHATRAKCVPLSAFYLYARRGACA